MPKYVQPKALQWRAIEATKDKALQAGLHQDGPGLYLRVSANGEKTWMVRVNLNGKRTWRSLGAYRRSTMDEVRALAEAALMAAKQGIDLLNAKREEAASQRELQSEQSKSFSRVAEDYWKRTKAKSDLAPTTVARWHNCLNAYVLPVIGQRPIRDIRPSEILKVLEPIWDTKTETARRCKQAMQEIFDDAIRLEIRERGNPCHRIEKSLTKATRQTNHHKALPWDDVSRFYAERLGDASAGSSTILCFRFLILTALRSGEVRGARWEEFDMDKAVWNVPAERMKMGRAHRVPLCPPALAVLNKARVLGHPELVFPSPNSGKELSDNMLSKFCRDAKEPCTPHGFRTSFKTWAVDVARVDDLLSEICLAHLDKDRVRRAYQRSDRLEERRPLMEEWAQHVTGLNA